MVLAEAVKTSENSYTVESAMNVLLSKLDEALDDVEHGRVLDEDELWAEIAARQSAVWDYWKSSNSNACICGV